MYPGIGNPILATSLNGADNSSGPQNVLIKTGNDQKNTIDYRVSQL